MADEASTPADGPPSPQTRSSPRNDNRTPAANGNGSPRTPTGRRNPINHRDPTSRRSPTSRPSSSLRGSPPALSNPTTPQRNPIANPDTTAQGTLAAIPSAARPPRPPTRSPANSSIVQPTPQPSRSLVPGPHRRELGASPIRFQTPTPQNDTASDDARANDTQTYLWDTNISVEDCEQRVVAFINGFRFLERTNAGSSSDVPNPIPSTPASVPELDEEILPGPAPAPSSQPRSQQPPRSPPQQSVNAGQPSSPAEPFYIDVLRHLSETGESIANIDLSHLHAFDSLLYRRVIEHPEDLITIFDATINRIFCETFPNEAQDIEQHLRKSIQTRMYNLLPGQVQSMRELNPSDISKMVAIRGMVIRASTVIPDIQAAMYRCTKCHAMQEVNIAHGRIEEPRKCMACNSRDSFSLIHSRSQFADKQMVRLQEAPENIPKGETPATFTLVMYDSLVDSVKPGDRVEITGMLRAVPVRVNPKLRTVRSVFRTYIDCVHVRTLNHNQSRQGLQNSVPDKDVLGNPTDPTADLAFTQETMTTEQKKRRKEYFDELACHPELYQRLADSIAPSIFGMEDEKKGVLLQLFGGAKKNGQNEANAEANGDGSARFRSAINILLVGDPGTSKSQLLHSAHRLAPRGVYTSGRGSSAVGLTAYVTRDPDSDDYVLESGALVLSDRGVCCIDEFDKMSEYARSVLHEAMEQQTVSIAKAGIIATLNARTSVLAAANPVNSRYDTTKPVVENIDLPPTLLSRFDLIFLVLDAPNAESDRRLAKHIVSLFFKNYDESREAKQEQNNTSRTEDDLAAQELVEFDDEMPTAPSYGSGKLLDAKTLTEYIAYARETVDPKLTDSAADALVNGYVEMRSAGRGGGTISATPRQLESLIRLAEAHARMQLKNDVEEEDVHEAMRLVKSALRMSALDPNTGKIDMNLFAAGKSRGDNTMANFLERTIIDKLKEMSDGGGLHTSKLLTALRETSDAVINAGDLREALRALEQKEEIVFTHRGTLVQLV
eukprot:TRINITY_DN3847_c0_g1_i1.p1 TRINITY_DN3847_c0_g1~~TRINITY_DN3847_c0_g1_i1.p1  ORF type:complete len:1006 (+),score=170.50 TRINITY_DN3847_c0_g1_i1:126-3143(+)